MRRRFGKPTTAGYVVLAILAILIVGIVVGVIIGGGAGATIDAVGGFLIVAFILILVGPMTPPRARRRSARSLSRASWPGRPPLIVAAAPSLP
jgi:hypothetical protein